MAETTFSAQITNLVGGTIDQDACDDWAAEACKEIINVLPAKLKAKCATRATLNASATTLDLDGKGDILHITRLSADSGGYEQPCREIPAMYGDLTNDSTDLNYYATAGDPVFFITNNSSGNPTLFVRPNPTNAQPSYVHHIAYPTVNVDASTIEIANFPDEAKHLVVLYAAVKQLHQYMNLKRNDLPSDLVAPVLELISESLPTWSAPSDFVAPAKPVVPSLSAQSVTITGTAPTFIKPVRVPQTAFSSYSSGLSETDPGIFSISSVAPVIPTPPSYTTPDISSTTISSTLVSDLGTIPTYTAPKVTGDTQELTATIVAGAVGSTGDYINYEHWFDVLTDMIETNEDIEMASVQLNKISTYIQSYQVALQHQLNIFNKENVAYQAKVQEGMQQAQIDASRAQGQAQISATEAQQEASLLLQKEAQEYSAKLQKYQSELSTYQANVSKEVQEYGQKLQQYSIELNSSYQAWAKTESDNISAYQTDIQNELNKFNKENVEYQTKFQKDVQDASFSDIDEARKLQKYQSEIQAYASEVNTNAQTFANEVVKNRAAFDTSMQKYASEVQKVSASNSSTLQKFQAETADYSTKLQKQGIDYQWYQGQYAALKADYQQGLQQLIGG